MFHHIPHGGTSSHHSAFLVKIMDAGEKSSISMAHTISSTVHISVGPAICSTDVTCRVIVLHGP